jgi:hypothetical protein
VSVVFSEPPRVEWFVDAFEPRRTEYWPGRSHQS